MCGKIFQTVFSQMCSLLTFFNFIRFNTKIVLSAWSHTHADLDRKFVTDLIGSNELHFLRPGNFLKTDLGTTVGSV